LDQTTTFQDGSFAAEELRGRQDREKFTPGPAGQTPRSTLPGVLRHAADYPWCPNTAMPQDLYTSPNPNKFNLAATSCTKQKKVL
jgi:hypothetical protein